MICVTVLGNYALTSKWRLTQNYARSSAPACVAYRSDVDTIYGKSIETGWTAEINDARSVFSAYISDINAVLDRNQMTIGGAARAYYTASVNASIVYIAIDYPARTLSDDTCCMTEASILFNYISIIFGSVSSCCALEVA